MNTNELMRADWVSYNGTPYQVSIISNDMVTIVNEKLDNVDRDDIEPIPITPDILENNGFEHLVMDGEPLEGEFYFSDDNIGCEIWFFCKGDRLETDSLTVESDSSHVKKQGGKIYVHELQHALRLCGIEKEIKP